MKKTFILFVAALIIASEANAARVLSYLEDSTPTGDDQTYVINSPTGPAQDRRASLGNIVTKAHGIAAWYMLYIGGSGVMTGLPMGGSNSILLSNGETSSPSFYDATQPINAGAPNGSSAKIHWSQLTGVPSGFADGSDDGEGGGTMSYPDAGVPLSTGYSWGASYSVGTGPNNLVQLNASGQMPAIPGANLTLLNDDAVAFDDADGVWASTNVGAALEELNDYQNSGLPNGANTKVHWSQLTGVPAGFADGTDDGASGGSGYTTIQEEGSALTARAILNFVGAGFTAADDGANVRTNLTLDSTLSDIADGTISENLVNTANPWADDEVANNLTISGGSVDNSPIGAGTPSTGAFTSVSIGNAGTLGPGATTSGNTIVYRLYDNDGAAWVPMLSGANGNMPTFTAAGAWDFTAATLTFPALTGTLSTAASTTSAAGFRLPHGTAPTAPTNGDLWTTTGGLYARINGATIGPFATGGTPTWDSVTSPTGALAITMDSATEDSTFTMSTGDAVWNFQYTGAFTSTPTAQFLIQQQTGNPTGGTLLDVRAADSDVTVFKAGDGTNGISVSQAGALTAIGTGSITATAANAGGIILGDSTPDANGEVGYASNGFYFYGNSEDLSVTAGTNSWTINSATGVTDVYSALPLRAPAKFLSYDTSQTLTAATHNGAVVMLTIAGEITLWDCTASTIGHFVTLWPRDAEKIEVVPASGDQFYLLNGTGIGANDELDMAATAGAKVCLMCTAADEWRVFSEMATTTDGGAAD